MKYFVFKIAGLNMIKDKSILQFVLKNGAKIKLKHAPYKSPDGRNDDPHAIKILAEVNNKWEQIGWIPRRDKHFNVSPNKILIERLKSGKKIRKVEIVKFGTFYDVRKRYYGSIKVWLE